MKQKQIQTQKLKLKQKQMLNKYRNEYIIKGIEQALMTGGRLTEIQLIKIVFYHLIEIMLIT
jgi:hypothetical protein